MILLFQKWISVETDHLICNPVRAQEIPDSFGDEKHDLVGRNVKAIFSKYAENIP